MERVFTQTVGKGGRWPKGHRADWPMAVWRQVAASLGEDLDAFSAPVEAVVQAATGAAVGAGAGAEAPRPAAKRR